MYICGGQESSSTEILDTFTETEILLQVKKKTEV